MLDPTSKVTDAAAHYSFLLTGLVMPCMQMLTVDPVLESLHMYVYIFQLAPLISLVFLSYCHFYKMIFD